MKITPTKPQRPQLGLEFKEGVIRGGSEKQELPKFLPSSYMASTNLWRRTHASYNNNNCDQLVESVDENHPSPSLPIPSKARCPQQRPARK